MMYTAHLFRFVLYILFGMVSSGEVITLENSTVTNHKLVEFHRKKMLLKQRALKHRKCIYLLVLIINTLKYKHEILQVRPCYSSLSRMSI